MNVRSVLMTAAVSLALAGLAGCDREPETTTGSANESKTAPESTTTTPSTPPAASTSPSDSTTSTPPSSSETSPSTADKTSSASGASSAGAADRSAGQTVDDATVTAKVKAALMAEDGVDGTKINVDTFNGRVTLKGEVPDKTMIDRAVQVAKSVEGVKDVDNRLNAAGAG